MLNIDIEAKKNLKTHVPCSKVFVNIIDLECKTTTLSTCSILNETWRIPSILSKYMFEVHQCISRTLSGKANILVSYRCRTLLYHVYLCWFVLLHILWYTLWHLVVNVVVCLIMEAFPKLVVNVVVHLNVGGVPKAWHVEFRQVVVEDQQNMS